MQYKETLISTPPPKKNLSKTHRLVLHELVIVIRHDLHCSSKCLRGFKVFSLLYKCMYTNKYIIVTYYYIREFDSDASLPPEFLSELQSASET